MGINHIKVSVLQEDCNRHVFTEKYGNATEFYRHVFHDLKDWGFNTLGNYNDEDIPQKIPFVHLFRFVNISGYLASWKFREEFSPLPYEYFPDIFSESWREECEKKVAEVQANFRDNQFLIRRYDSYHLLLGDCYDGNPGIPEFVLQEARPYVDALSLQYYQLDPFEEHFKRIDYWYRIIEKPVIATDSCYAVPKPKMPDPYGPHVSGHRERGLSYRRYVEALFGRPYGIGWLWCGYIDWLQGSGPPGKQVVHLHSGIKDVWESPYKPLIQAIKRVNANIYHIATGKKRYEMVQ